MERLCQEKPRPWVSGEGGQGQSRGWCLSAQGCGDRAFPLCCSAHTSPEGDL